VSEYKLTKEEISRQLHQMIQDLYPESSYDPNLIHKLLFESRPGEVFMFPAGDFAEINNLDSTDFADKLHTELDIEFEKNLHDKFLFEMTRDDNTIFFKMVKSNPND
jgi:hypothetical protein